MSGVITVCGSSRTEPGTPGYETAAALGRALAGEVETLAGERLFFAVFLGHHRLSSSRATGLIDDIMVALAEVPPQ